MADRRKAPAPKNLGTAGLALWRAVTDKWTLRPDELRVLEDACRDRTWIETMERQIDQDGLMLAGSMGQPVDHPLLARKLQYEAGFVAKMKFLGLDDDAMASEGESRSSQARDAAKSRWSVAHGKAS